MSLSLVQNVLSNEDYESLLDHIGDVVVESFTLRPMPLGVITEDECERRTEICGEIWNVLYGDLKWTSERTRDHMKAIMVCVLDGGKISDFNSKLVEEKRSGTSMWAPDQLGDIEPERRLSALVKDSPVIIGEKGRN